MNYDGILNKKLSAEGDTLREKAYNGYFDWERGEKIDDKDCFRFIVFCVALYAFNNAKSNKDNLSSYLHQYENLIDDLICQIVIKVDTLVLGYFSRGKLNHKKDYIIEDKGYGENGQLLGKNFTINNKNIFDELNKAILPLGEKYIADLFEIIFSIQL